MILKKRNEDIKRFAAFFKGIYLVFTRQCYMLHIQGTEVVL
jgi:hypothetical protein